jgi:hypothetical protein
LEYKDRKRFSFTCSISKNSIKDSLIKEALNKNRGILVEDVFEKLCTISNLIPYYKPCHDRSTHQDNVYNVTTEMVIAGLAELNQAATSPTDSTKKKRRKLELKCHLCSDKMNSQEALERHVADVHEIMIAVLSPA